MYIDSDIMTYVDYSNLPQMKQYDAGLTIPKDQEPFVWCANAGISFWNREALRDLVSYFEYTYTIGKDRLLKKWQYHCDSKVPGGICDMTLEYLWSLDTKLSVCNMANSCDGVFDYNINTPDNYAKNEYKLDGQLKIKKLVTENEKAYLIKKDGSKERVYAAHFLGPAKKYMPMYAKHGKIPMSARLQEYIDDSAPSLVRKVYYAIMCKIK